MERKIKDSNLLTGKFIIEEINDTGEVVQKQEKHNIIVDVAGAETVAKYINGDAPLDFNFMLIGTGNASAPSEGDTALETRVDTSPSLSSSLKTTGGVSKIVEWSYTFSSGTGKTSVVEAAMGNSSTTAAGILNRITFAAKDNANNDLKITYQLIVS